MARSDNVSRQLGDCGNGINTRPPELPPVTEPSAKKLIHESFTLIAWDFARSNFLHLHQYSVLDVFKCRRMGSGRQLVAITEINNPSCRHSITRSEERRVGKECRSRWSP